jgi:hypothetical protein
MTVTNFTYTKYMQIVSIGIRPFSLFVSHYCLFVPLLFLNLIIICPSSFLTNLDNAHQPANSINSPSSLTGTSLPKPPNQSIQSKPA